MLFHLIASEKSALRKIVLCSEETFESHIPAAELLP